MRNRQRSESWSLRSGLLPAALLALLLAGAVGAAGTARGAGGGTPEVLPESTGTQAIVPVPVLNFAAEKPAAYEEGKDLPFAGDVLLLAGHPAGQPAAAPVIVRQLLIGDAYADKWRRLHLVDGDLKSVAYTEMGGYDRHRGNAPNAGRLDIRPYDFPFRLGVMSLDRESLAPVFTDRPARVNYLVVESTRFPAPQGAVYAWSAEAKGWAKQPVKEFKDNTAAVLTLRLAPVETSRINLRLTPTGSAEKKSFDAREVMLYEVSTVPAALAGEPISAGAPEKLTGGATAAFTERTGISGAALTLAATGAVDGLYVLSLLDPASAEYVVARLVFRAQAKAGEEIDFFFDFPDVVAEKGEKLTFTLEPLAGPGGALPVAPTLASCRLAKTDAKQAAGEFAGALRKRAALEYSEGAEGWQWENRTEDRPDIAGPTFDRILALDPENLLTKMYLSRIRRTGKKARATKPAPEVPAPDVAPRLKGPANAPGWAVAARALLQEQVAIASWWADERMQSDGQMGGGWNDDCELTFRWAYLPLVTGEDKFRRALQLYADGIWASGRIDHTNGYCCVPGLWDVEHACEETTCTQPFLVLLNYGDPEYVERNMLTISNFDFWTGGLNPNGHRHFRSVWFQGQAFRNEVTDDKAFDHPYCAYALTPGLAAVWYNDQPLAKKWLHEYAKSWVEDIVGSREGKGRRGGGAAKGKGKALPRNIQWIDCSTKGGQYYPGGSGNVMHVIRSVAYLTRDVALLEAHETMHVSNPDSTGLFADPLMSRMFSRNTPDYHARDEEILADAAGEDGQAMEYFNAWLLTGKKEFLERGCKVKLAEAVATRFLNSEADPPSDRSYLAGDELLTCMYLGGYGFPREDCPYLAVSWSGLGSDFAALVLENDEKHVKALVYSFAGEEKKAEVRVWELAHGKYTVRFGPADTSDKLVQAALDEKAKELGRGDRIALAVPGQTPCLLELTQEAALDDLRARADLAVTWRDVRYEPTKKRLVIRVHNIGIAPAKNVQVVVRLADGKELAAAPVAELAAPLDLKARVVEVAVPYEPDGKAIKVLVDPANAIPELTEENNATAVNIPTGK